MAPDPLAIADLTKHFGPVLARLWPDYDVMRTEPRFNAIVDRLHLPRYHAGIS